MSTEISAEYIKAKELDRKIKTSAQLAQQSLYDMCMGFKEMRDGKLYKELGYQNFEEYCEKETGIKHSQAYKFINIAEKMPDDFFHPGGNIGVSKLYLLSTLSEDDRKEITENNDVSKISKRELEAKIADLKAQNGKLMDKLSEEQEKSAKSSSSESKAWGEVSILKTDNEFFRQKIDQLESKVKEKEDDISSLESQIEELENRPIDVAFSESDSHEIENLKKAMKTCDDQWAAKYSELQESTIIHNREIHQDYKAQIEKLTADYEKKLAELPLGTAPEQVAVPDVKETFKAYYSMAYNAFNTMIGFVKKQSEDDRQFCLEKSDKLIDILKESMQEV